MMIAEFEFTYPIVDVQGQIVERRAGRARRLVEILAPGVSLELVEVPAGSMRMGSAHGQGYPDEEPQHFVQLPTFWIGQHPVTQAQWQALMGGHRGRFSGADLPVDTISWVDSVRFCEKLSRKTGRRYTLPSEAQWEYACRAGTSTPFSFGPVATTELANYNGEFTYRGGPRGVYRHTTLPIGSLPPNPFGLFDLHGGLWEWCADAWHDDYNGAPVDGSPWSGGPRDEYRVARGGCWHDIPEVCRSAARLRYLAGEGDEIIGIRVVLNQP